MFPLLGVICFLRQRCTPGGRFPCGLTFGSHLVVSNVGPSDGAAEVVYCDIQPRRSWLQSFFVGCALASILDRAGRSVARIPRCCLHGRYADFAVAPSRFIGIRGRGD